MGDAIGATLGFAVGIAISPIPIAATILMLFSDRARTNGVAFLVAWFVGILLVVTVVQLIPGLAAESSGPSDTAGWIKLALGLLLLAGGLRQWFDRPGPDDDPPLPGWMERIDDLAVGAAIGLGFALSALNPKNLLLAAAAGATLGTLGLTASNTIVTVVVFAVLASLTIGIPVLGYLVAADRLTPVLDRAKVWLVANNTAVMAVLFVVFGVNLLGDGLQILT